MFNHIPGKKFITLKHKVIDNHFKYLQKYQLDNKTKCEKSITHHPETYRLYKKKECE